MLLGALALVCACTSGEETKELGVNGVSHGAAARKLQTCGFLLNKDFKENAKYYLCLFSASWCGPCRREMPRIAKTYAESLKADPNIELIHFSRDNDENKALAWAKEHDVKFPVVKYNGGNPLDLHSRGIPHLFIVDADGKLIEEGHPAKLFTNEKLNALKAGKLAAPETATEKTRKAIAKLFPGWSLDTEVCDHDFAGIQPLIRGKRNVTFVHPKNRETPSVISRTVKLFGNNPCLSLCVASWNDDADFQLSVRVNGMDALTNRIVCTTDAAPWEDIVVPLSAWRGSTAKIEVVFTAYGRYWCEFPCLARVDIIEADGDMSIKDGKCEVGGYTWSYRAQNGEATIVAENDGRFSTAVSPCPVGDITIPATLAGAKVTHIGRDAFLDCSALTSVTIPEGVSRIGRGAFHDCTGLKSIKIPSSVKIIERDTFLGCNGLASVSIPEGVTIIDRGAFIRCYGLESIEIPSSVTQIGRDAFCNCGKLTSVTIPEKVTDIGYGAFHGCNALTSVTIPASVTNINLVAFRNTGALTSFHVAPGNRFYKSENGLLLTKDGTTLVRGVNGDATIPPSVTAIGGCAFEGCVALRSAEIPSGVKSIGPCAFKQCRGMKSVTIPSSVMDIGREAFSNCKGLKSITIPQGVTAIRNSTFSRSALIEVTIPANVKVLERGAFSWCGELKSVTFPEGMTIIGRDAFYNCGKLTSLIIPSSVRRIDQGAFHGCGSLTLVTMRGERPNAPNNIFERCGNLKSIHVPANAKSWAGMKKWLGIPLVFDGEANGNALRMSPSTLNRLGAPSTPSTPRGLRRLQPVHAGEWTDPATGYTWSYRITGDTARIFKSGAKENLYASVAISPKPKGDLTIPSHLGGKTVTSIGYSAFDGCNDLTSITIPSSVTDFGQRAFYGCGGLKSFVVDPNNTSYKSVNGLLLSKDGTRLIYGINGDVTIPNGVISIADEAFDGRTGLTSVTIPNSVTNIGQGAFYGCSGLKSFVVDPNNTSYKSVNGLLLSKDGTRLICSVNGDVTIPNSVTCIEEYAFSGCSGLTSVTILNSVTNIEEGAFSGCGGLKSLVVDPNNTSYKSVNGLLLSKDGKRLICGNNGDVTIPNGVISIANEAFFRCKGLTSVTIPNSVANIGDCAFAGCSSLTNVTLPNSVTDIGNQAFSGCRGLKSLTIPRRVTNIEMYAFNGCSGLTSVTIPNSVTNIGDCAFAGCSSLTSVTMPSSVTSIGQFAFRGCRNLTSVTIPNSVTNIRPFAFQDCSNLTSVTMPSSVTNILLETFKGCNELTSVTMCGECPRAYRNLFQDCRKLKSIHVPANAKSWVGMKEWMGIPLAFDAK